MSPVLHLVVYLCMQQTTRLRSRCNAIVRYRKIPTLGANVANSVMNG